MTVTVCEKCGEQIGAPHLKLPGDCVLEHPDHTYAEHGLLCRRHFHWIGDTLTQITELAALLPDVMEPRTGTSDGPRSGAVDAPAPLSLVAVSLTNSNAKAPGTIRWTYERNWNGRTFESNGEDVIDVPGSLRAIAETIEYESGTQMRQPRDQAPLRPTCALTPDPQARLTSWDRLTCDHGSCRAVYPRPITLSEIVTYLRRMRPWIVNRDADTVTDFVEDIYLLHRALASGVGDSMFPRSIGKCPNCTKALYNTIGVDEVTCRNRKCQSSWTGIALVRLRLILEQDQAKAAGQ